MSHQLLPNWRYCGSILPIQSLYSQLVLPLHLPAIPSPPPNPKHTYTHTHTFFFYLPCAPSLSHVILSHPLPFYIAPIPLTLLILPIQPPASTLPILLAVTLHDYWTLTHTYTRTHTHTHTNTPSKHHPSRLALIHTACKQLLLCWLQIGKNKNPEL